MTHGKEILASSMLTFKLISSMETGTTNTLRLAAQRSVPTFLSSIYQAFPMASPTQVLFFQKFHED